MHSPLKVTNNNPSFLIFAGHIPTRINVPKHLCTARKDNLLARLAPVKGCIAGTEPNVVVRIRRRIVQIEREHARIRLVVEVAATDRSTQGPTETTLTLNTS